MTKTGLAASIVALAVMGGLSAWGWFATPADLEIPVHWNAAGEVDRYGGKAEAFLLIPGVTLLLSALFAAAPHIDPRGRNLKASGPAFVTIWLGVLAVVTLAHGVIVLTALGLIEASGQLIPRLVLGGVCVLMVLIGNVLGKARPNWFVGVRTPWTLSSDKAWDATHRWAGRGFVVGGLAGAAALLLAPVEIALTIFLTCILATAAGSIALSYVVWRTDPDRETFSER